MEDTGVNAALCQHVSMAEMIFSYFMLNFTMDDNVSTWTHPGNNSLNFTTDPTCMWTHPGSIGGSNNSGGDDTSDLNYYAVSRLQHSVGSSSSTLSSVKKHLDFHDDDYDGSSVEGRVHGDAFTSLATSSSSSATSSPTWFRIIIPAISTVGIAGNLLSIVVLTRQRLLSTMQRLERSVTHCLTALAVSDLLFCVAVLPQGGFHDEVADENGGEFVETSSQQISSSPLTLAYRVYGVAVVNLLLMQSTWMVTMMAACRFLVVVYPLRARQRLTGRVTVASIAAVVGVSVIMTAPHFVATSVGHCWTVDKHTRQVRWHYEMVETELYHSVSFYVRWVWPVCSTFIPLAALGTFNVRLVRELNAARRSMSATGYVCTGTGTIMAPSVGGYPTTIRRVVSKVSLNNGVQLNDGLTVTRTTAAGRKVTLTLTVIILMNLGLVTPSELLKYANYYGHVLAYVANAMQALNFAVNFFLYCILNPHFRLTVTRIFGCRSQQTIIEARRGVHNGDRGDRGEAVAVGLAAIPGDVFVRRGGTPASAVVRLRTMRRDHRRPFDQHCSMKNSCCPDVGLLMSEASSTSSPLATSRRRAIDSKV